MGEAGRKKREWCLMSGWWRGKLTTQTLLKNRKICSGSDDFDRKSTLLRSTAIPNVELPVQSSPPLPSSESPERLPSSLHSHLTSSQEGQVYQPFACQSEYNRLLSLVEVPGSPSPWVV